MDSQVVVFKLAEEYYGVDIADVERIIKLQPITSIPYAPDFVEGVTNLRGSVLPVIDLRKRFDLADAGTSQDTRIVIFEIPEGKVGVVVDAVTEVLSISDADVELPSPLVMTAKSEFIVGIAKVSERLIILMDLRQVLSDREKYDLQRVRTQIQEELVASS